MIATEAILEMPMPSQPDFARELTAHTSGKTFIRTHEPLAKHTTLRVGGPADVYVCPPDESDLAIILKLCKERGVPFFILGRGSNLLVRDGGFRGVVICLLRPEFDKIEIIGERIQCRAGAKLKNVAVEARRNGLSGLEFLEGIPGTVGGALRMNAGAMGSQTFDAVEFVRLMDYDGNIYEMTPQEMEVGYRICGALKNHIALAAVFKCKTFPREEIEVRMKSFSEKRWGSQPAAPSAGCIFKNPASIPAGKLIQDLGLKGTSVGGALVSNEHGNFIINDGKATARNVLDLIEILKAKAKAERGIELHTEVEIVGED